MSELGVSSIRQKTPVGKRRWIGILMKNGVFHVKEYLGPANFRSSNVYLQYNESPFVEKMIGPFMIDRKDDHKAIMRGMLRRKK